MCYVRSSRKCSYWVLVVIGAALAATTTAQSRDEAVLRFYWDRARAVSAAGDPDAHGARYSFEATTYYKSIGKQGVVTLEDSVREIRYCSFGRVDSTRVIVAPKRESLKADVVVPHVFDSSYILNFFPNDTGGPEIALGFEADSVHTDLPVGLAILDRQQYLPRWLYLNYPHQTGYRHLSRSFRFTRVDGFIFPDSVWEVGVIDGIFSTRSFRIETGITNLKVYR